MEVADFVFINNQYGIGKIVSIKQDKVDIEFFINIGEQVVKRYSIDKVERVYLGNRVSIYKQKIARGRLEE